MNKTRWLQKTDFSRLWANTVPWLIFTCARPVRLHLSTTASAAAELSRTGSSKNQHFSEQPPPLISRPLARTSCSVSAFSTHFSSSYSMGSLALASLPQNSWIRPSLFCRQHGLALRVFVSSLWSPSQNSAQAAASESSTTLHTGTIVWPQSHMQPKQHQSRLQVVAIWLKKQINDVEIQSKVASNKHSAVTNTQDS